MNKQKIKKYFVLKKVPSVLLLFIFLFAPILAFAVNKYPASTAFQIGEFLYNDDYTPSTTDCLISIWNPSGVKVVDEVTMDEEASGWHYYDFAGSATLGTWPVEIACGTAGVDLIKQNKTFVLESPAASLSDIQTASSSIAAVVNANTNTASSSFGSLIQTSSSSVVSQLVSSIPTLVWGFSGRTLDSFGTLVADIWSSGSRTLTSFGTLVSDTATGVWGAATRRLTDATLDSGSLATLSNLQTASSSIVSEINSNTDTETSGITSAVNANTDTRINNASTSVVALVNANTNSEASGINSNTDAAILAASTSLAANINSNTNAQVLAASSSLGSLINTASSSIVSQILGSVTSIPANVWSYSGRTLTSFGTLVSDTATGVWASATRTLTSGGSITAADVWGYATRRLTDANLDSGSIATLGNLQTASSSIVSEINTNTDSETSGITSAVNANTDSRVQTASTSIAAAITASQANINSNTNAQVLSASTSLASAISDISITSGVWSTTLSNTKEVEPGYTYRAKVQITSSGESANPASAPSVTIYDSSRNVVVSGVSMTNISTGIYEYTYSVPSGAAQGSWETIVDLELQSGKNTQVNDFWKVTGSPAQVIINNINDNIIPSVSANLTITNEGLSGYEYQYEWCVVSDITNTCGDGDDVYHATAAKYINPGEDFNTTLTATVPSAGNYYFKSVVYFGTDSSGASRSFTAVSEEASSGSSGGGGGGSSAAAIAPTIVETTYHTADSNGDNKVDSVDFSIMLSFWQKQGPFKNTGVDINKDGKVNSIDFSILLFQWKK